MVEWQWLVTVGLFGVMLGAIIGMIRVSMWHHKLTGKWIYEEKGSSND